VLVQAREVEEDASDVRAQRVAKEAEQRAQRLAIRVWLDARAPAVRDEAHAAVSGAQRGSGLRGREVEVSEVLDQLSALQRLQPPRAQGASAEQPDVASLEDRSELVVKWTEWTGRLVRAGAWAENGLVEV
jgi:hypothetical protein